MSICFVGGLKYGQPAGDVNASRELRYIGGRYPVSTTLMTQGKVLPMRAVVIVLLLQAVAPIVVAALPEAQEAPEDAAGFEGHHYLIFDEVEDLTWAKGKQKCESLGATLAVITTKEEAEFIAQLIDGRYLFLGATDAAEEGTWEWVDGSAWGFTSWMSGQPNDYGGSEDYLATYDDGEWVDVEEEGAGFWMPTGYLCEWID
jgi:hypothetical protein